MQLTTFAFNLNCNTNLPFAAPLPVRFCSLLPRLVHAMQMKRLWHATTGFPPQILAEHSRRVHCFSICAGRFNCKAGQNGPQLNGLAPFGSIWLGRLPAVYLITLYCVGPLKWDNLPSGRQAGKKAGGLSWPGTCTYPHFTSGSIDSRSTPR